MWSSDHGFSDNIIHAVTARFIMGIGSAFGFIGAVKVATIILPPNRISIGVGMTILCGTLGALIAGRPLKWLSEIYHWRDVVLYMSYLGIALSLILFIALSSVLIKINLITNCIKLGFMRYCRQ